MHEKLAALVLKVKADLAQLVQNIANRLAVSFSIIW